MDNPDESFAAIVQAPCMALVLPTYIMLGRGPTCYNNPGNRVFRKLVKENVVHYKNQARRREKAALVRSLISKLGSQDFRFLHRSTSGIWVEAPTHVVEKKVGHGLRDARLSAYKNGCDDMNVLPKNFRPAITEPKNTDKAVPVLVQSVNTSEEKRGTKSDKKAAISTLVENHCHPTPSKLKKKAEPVVASSSVSSLMMPLNLASVPQEFPLADGVRQYAGLSFGVSDMRGNSSFELEQRLEHMQRSWDGRMVPFMLPDGARMNRAAYGTHNLDSVGMALHMYGQSSDNVFVDDPYHPLPCDVEDAQSLCRWFSHLM
jgi:hypothetical protein